MKLNAFCSAGFPNLGAILKIMKALQKSNADLSTVNLRLKLFSIFLCIFLLSSCTNPPYLHHKLQFDKVADNCSAVSQKFQMNSNINGERYEFNKCLPVNFTKENATISRQGDTVVVRFDTKNAVKTSEFHIILDIDTYPRYNFLTIDGDTFIIVPTSG